MAWALGLRNLQIPGAVMDITGMPFDHARNVACMKALEIGATHCLRPGVLVETREGGKKIEDVQVGDYVRTHLGRFRRVYKTFRRELKSKSPLLLINTMHGSTKCTPEHPFFVRRENGSYQFVRAENLVNSDRLLYPDVDKEDWLDFDIKFNTIGVNGDGKKGSIKNGQSLDRVPVTDEIARFMGLYLAEGCGTHDGICFTFNNKEGVYRGIVRRVSALLFGREPSITKRWATNVKINVRPLSAKFKGWFGERATVKKIPDFVFSWSLKHKLHFIMGYLEGDGHYSHVSNCWSFRTASGQLVEDITRLASCCGLVVRSCAVKPAVSVTKEGNEIRSIGSYQGSFSKKSGDKLSDLLEAERNGDYLELPIFQIENKGMSNARDKGVYNIEVEEDHSYIADCSSVHNCFFIDSDVIAPSDTVLKLLAHKQPIISGVYCRRSPPVGVPVMMKPLGQWITQYPANSIIEVDVVGTGCLLIERKVLETFKPQRPGKHWFDWRVDMKGVLPIEQCLSEDFTFCQSAIQQGYKILVDTSIQCRHVGLCQSVFGRIEPLHHQPVA